MKRDLAIKGLNRAVRDHMGGMFETLLANIREKVDQPFSIFANGLDKVSKAYDAALIEINKLPE